MKSSILTFIIVFIAFAFNIEAQIKDSAYHFMLRVLYSGSVSLIDCEKFKSIYEKVILDTRAKGEYKVSHIKGAQWVGYESFGKSKVRHLPKDTTIVVYCAVGYRSEKIGKRLQKLGYNKVYNLYGGIFEWINQDNLVYDEHDKVTQKIHAYSRTWGIWLKKGNKVYK